MTSKEIAESLKNQNKSAIMFLQAGQYEQAYIAFGNYLKDLVDYQFYDHAAKTRVNMANTLLLMKKYPEALECLRASLDFFVQKKDYDSLNENRILEGNLYMAMDKFDELKALSERMISSTKSDRLKDIASMFKIYAEKNNGKVTLDLINKAISFAERAKDNAVLKQILTLRVDYYEQKKQPLYAMMDRERIRAL